MQDRINQPDEFYNKHRKRHKIYICKLCNLSIKLKKNRFTYENVIQKFQLRITSQIGFSLTSNPGNNIEEHKSLN
jgi:hypothetical protein